MHYVNSFCIVSNHRVKGRNYTVKKDLVNRSILSCPVAREMFQEFFHDAAHLNSISRDDPRKKVCGTTSGTPDDWGKDNSRNKRWLISSLTINYVLILHQQFTFTRLYFSTSLSLLDSTISVFFIPSYFFSTNHSYINHHSLISLRLKSSISHSTPFSKLSNCHINLAKALILYNNNQIKFLQLSFRVTKSHCCFIELNFCFNDTNLDDKNVA